MKEVSKEKEEFKGQRAGREEKRIHCQESLAGGGQITRQKPFVIGGHKAELELE